MATAKNTFSWEDPFHLSAQLTDDERQVQEAARAYCQEKLLPRRACPSTDSGAQPTLRWRPTHSLLLRTGTPSMLRSCK